MPWRRPFRGGPTIGRGMVVVGAMALVMAALRTEAGPTIAGVFAFQAVGLTAVVFGPLLAIDSVRRLGEADRREGRRRSRADRIIRPAMRAFLVWSATAGIGLVVAATLVGFTLFVAG